MTKVGPHSTPTVVIGNLAQEIQYIAALIPAKTSKIDLVSLQNEREIEKEKIHFYLIHNICSRINCINC